MILIRVNSQADRNREGEKLLKDYLQKVKLIKNQITLHIQEEI